MQQVAIDLTVLQENEECNVWRKLGNVSEFNSLLCQNHLWNKEVILGLKTEKFDLAIVDVSSEILYYAQAGHMKNNAHFR